MRARPPEAGHAQLVGGVLEDQRIVRDHRAQHHHAALVHQPAVAVDHLLVVLPGKTARVGDDQLDGRTRPYAFVERVFEGQDRRVDPVSQQLVQVHVDQDPDLHRLERVALGAAPPRLVGTP